MEWLYGADSESKYLKEFAQEKTKQFLTLSHDIEYVLILNNIKGGCEILLFIRGVPFLN